MKIPSKLITSSLSLGALALLNSAIVAKETPASSDSAVSPRKWAQDSSDIKSDPSVVYGTLPNGMRYLLMPNKQPPGRVSMRLHIAAGSLMEREDQRGVAHFLEHMVFNGSKNFPDASQLIPKMQRLGIAFGAHANAYTSFNETVYMLDLPNNKEDTLKLGFDVMRDFGDGAFLRDEEIDKERGVILSEKTSRDSVQMRLMEKQFNSLLPDALLGKRFPIGTEEIIKSAPRKAFTDFYSQYYVPNRMTFVYTGDFDAKAAEKRIIETFGSMKNPDVLGKDPDLGKIPSGEGFKTLVLADKEVASTDLTLVAMKPYEKKPDTKATRAEKLPISMANSIIGRRFSILAKKENAPISNGEAYRQDLFDFTDLGGVSVVANNHNWKAALPVLEQELRRALLHGFTESELNEVKANLINAYQLAVKSAPSRKTNDLASSLAKHIHQDAVFSTPEDDLAILRENLDKVTVESCHQALKDFWATDDITLVLTTTKADADDEATLAKLYQESKKTEVSAPEKMDDASFAYTDFGQAGTIEKQVHVKEHDFTQITFHNGCHCNIKKTDFEKNSIDVSARVGAGTLTMPKSKPGLDMFASSTFTAGGLGKHSTDDLRRILAGRNAGVRFSAGDDAFTLSGGTTPEDLELQLQMICAYLTDPGFRPEAARLFKAQLPAIYSKLQHSTSGPQTKLNAYLRGNDPRFVFPTQEQASAFTTDDVKEWLMPAFKNGYLEISLIGDLDPEKVIPILARTIGALPKRSVSKPSYEAERALPSLPTPPQVKRYTFESRVAPGTAMVVWKGPGLNNDSIKTVRRLGIISSILSNRMREEIREKLGEAYSPYAGFQPSDVFNDLGYMLAVSPGKAEQAERVGKIIVEIGDKLATGNITEDELKRALEPKLSELKTSLRKNGYWLGTVMQQSQEQPYRLDWASERDEDYKSITAAELNALAKQYLGAKNAIRIEIVPVTEPTPEAP
ncbi:peptidase M16 [Oceaniferula spumae]|uniref:Peptidase M16 n=1 Tax=Oceaniferula spumae TaxID=2979115 RepID=A0AAT9FRJ3_9BACT